MTEPKMGEAFAISWHALRDFWDWKLAIGVWLSLLCEELHMDTLLAKLCFYTLVADICLGMRLAYMRKRPVCRALKRDLPRIICYLLSVVLAGVVQITFERALQLDMPVINLALGYLILTDCTSVIGKLDRLGYQIPALFKLVAFGGRRTVEKKIEDVIGDISEEPKDAGKK